MLTSSYPDLGLESRVCILSNVLLSNSLYRAARFANFEGILGFSVPSIILGGCGDYENHNTMRSTVLRACETGEGIFQQKI